MHHDEIVRVVAGLRPHRLKFRYFKDRYALMLLWYMLPAPRSIPVLRKSRVGRILSKPILKSLCGRLGGGLISRADLESVQPEHEVRYDLSIGHWGSDDPRRRGSQTSRPGCNLVLQLNLKRGIGRACRELLGNWDDGAHPHAFGRFTLAWARIDIDRPAREALIEEIQSDWTEPASVRAALLPHSRLWDEAVLAAAIRLLREDLNIHRIYYHTLESGKRFKGLGSTWCAPPRSVYTTLPQRFCFDLTRCPPNLLQTSRRCRKILRRHAVPWFVLRV